MGTELLCRLERGNDTGTPVLEAFPPSGAVKTPSKRFLEGTTSYSGSPLRVFVRLRNLRWPKNGDASLRRGIGSKWVEFVGGGGWGLRRGSQDDDSVPNLAPSRAIVAGGYTPGKVMESDGLATLRSRRRQFDPTKTGLFLALPSKNIDRFF